MDQQQKQDAREDSVQAASEGIINRTAGDLVDDAARSISKYVNTSAGDAVLADPDNEVKRLLLGLLLAYEERKRECEQKSSSE